jgi:hypothetical protein
MSAQIVTANRLKDGLVVYLGANDVWVARIENAEVAQGKDAAAALLARAEAPAQKTRVVGPYLMDVTLDDDTVRPASIREIIRALGPTVRTDLGYQAARGA